MKLRTDQRNYVIAALCAILIVMGVGYAAFSSLLTINGTANISNSWCVGFDNTKTSDLQITKGLSTGTQPTGSMSYSGTACGTNLVPTSSLVAHFYQPGDEIEYTLTITNKSTVTAAIKSILVDNESVTSDTTKKKDNITYIIEMPEDTTLAPNASTTMKVIARFQNDTDVTGPYSGETKTIEVKINAEQDDGNGGMVVLNPYTGSVYRNNSVNANVGDSIQNVGEYTTDASTLGKTYYLKHDVVNDIITASYVCFVYNNAEHCMKGGGGGASFAANTQIIQDYQTFYSLSNGGGSPGCLLNTCYGSCMSYCYGGSFGYVSANEYGTISVYDNYSENCFNDGSCSKCVVDGGFSSSCTG